MIALPSPLCRWLRRSAPRPSPATPAQVLPFPTDRSPRVTRWAAERWQAGALCDLLDDPRSGITGITVVGGGPGMADVVEAVASRRGLRVEGGARG